MNASGQDSNKDGYIKGRLLMSEPAAGAVCMAVDGELIHSVAATGVPVLRFYAWASPTVSVGCFQRREDIVSNARIAGVDVVVRPTGGRGILHMTDELTYAVVLPVALVGGKTVGTLEASMKIGEGIIQAFRQLGIEAFLERRKRGRAQFRSHLGGAASCWAAPAECEVVDDKGSKWVGSAQRRVGDTILQHGSIPRTFEAQKWEAVFGEGSVPNPPATSRLDFDRLAETIRDGLSKSLKIAWTPSSLTEDEVKRVQAKASNYSVLKT